MMSLSQGWSHQVTSLHMSPKPHPPQISYDLRPILSPKFHIAVLHFYRGSPLKFFAEKKFSPIDQRQLPKNQLLEYAVVITDSMTFN
jgi:hypothetical protein